MSVYDFKVIAQDGREVGLEEYEGKVLLIVNTATACGFTPQYQELQQLYEDNRDKGFEILDFPCNQFGSQAPGTDEEIRSFCTGRFGVTFPQFSKVEVKGENAIPLYRWLTGNAGFEGFDKNPMGVMLTQLLRKQDKDFDKNGDVKWNFTKFLIDREGNVAARFEPMTSLKKVRARVEELV